MKKIGFIFLTFLMLTCQKALDKPENLLSKETMSKIIADIYLYKQTPNNIPLTPNSAFDVYVSIFKKYKTSKEIFQDSFTYYYSDVESMEHIYDESLDILKNLLSKDELQKINNENLINNEK